MNVHHSIKTVFLTVINDFFYPSDIGGIYGVCSVVFHHISPENRGNNSERVLIVSGYWTNIDNTTAPDFVMPEDTASDRLMVSVCIQSVNRRRRLHPI